MSRAERSGEDKTRQDRRGAERSGAERSGGVDGGSGEEKRGMCACVCERTRVRLRACVRRR